MEGHPQIERYAWHDSKSGSSCLFDATGRLSATGRAYAAAGAGDWTEKSGGWWSTSCSNVMTSYDINIYVYINDIQWWYDVQYIMYM